MQKSPRVCFGNFFVPVLRCFLSVSAKFVQCHTECIGEFYRRRHGTGVPPQDFFNRAFRQSRQIGKLLNGQTPFAADLLKVHSFTSFQNVDKSQRENCSLSQPQNYKSRNSEDFENFVHNT